MLLAWGGLNTLMIHQSLNKAYWLAQMTPEQSNQLQKLGVVFPFLFAIMVLAGGLADYIRKSRDLAYKKKREDLILDIIRTANDCRTPEESIARTQARVARFIGATRSTLYILQNEGHETGDWLKADYLAGDSRIKTFADKEGGASFTRDDFMLLHVISRNLALLIRNSQLEHDSAA